MNIISTEFTVFDREPEISQGFSEVPSRLQASKALLTLFVDVAAAEVTGQEETPVSP